jgi:hypothetical protein
LFRLRQDEHHPAVDIPLEHLPLAHGRVRTGSTHVRDAAPDQSDAVQVANEGLRLAESARADVLARNIRARIDLYTRHVIFIVPNH